MKRETVMSELKEKFASLSIQVLSNHDGQYTVVSSSEPLFCFVRDDLESLTALVEDTLESYAKTFYDESVKVEMVEQVQPTPIPVRQLKPVKRLAPKLPFSFGGAELACAI